MLEVWGFKFSVPRKQNLRRHLLSELCKCRSSTCTNTRVSASLNFAISSSYSQSCSVLTNKPQWKFCLCLSPSFFFFLAHIVGKYQVFKCWGQNVCGFSNLNKENHLHCSQHCKRGPISHALTTNCITNTFWLLPVGWITHWEKRGWANYLRDWTFHQSPASQQRNAWG